MIEDVEENSDNAKVTKKNQKMITSARVKIICAMLKQSLQICLTK